MIKTLFQPEGAFEIPSSNIEVVNEGKDLIIRFDFKKIEQPTPIEGDVERDQPEQIECCEVRVKQGATYSDIVAAVVRFRYSQSDIEAVVLNKVPGELEELEDWRLHAKSIASEVLALDKTLEGVKLIKLRQLYAFDKSNEVNEFYFNGARMWIALDKRKDLRQSLIALHASGVEGFTFWKESTPITMSVSQFESILNSIEVYAINCYNTTAQHKAAIEELNSIEEVLNYDFKQGYPQKLNIRLE